MRLVYTAFWWLLLPLLLLRLWWRGRKEPGYRRHVGERLGFYRQSRLKQPLIWVHAVSVGETRAAEPLVKALLESYPGHGVILTHMTPTGRAAGRELFGANERVMQAYLPYDTSFMVRRFLRHFEPRICLLMETEIWPNLVACCRQAGIASVVVNARLSERSLARGRKFAALLGEAARGLSCALAQTEADARRLRQAGVPRVEVAGSVKFDVTPPAQLVERGRAWRRRFGQRPVLLCASTREGEEGMLLDAFAAQHARQDMLLLIVPRHPQRFEQVAQMVSERGLRLERRSGRLAGDAPVPESVQVLLGDSMGEMFAYYAASDLAFIGGSLLPLGGQNLIESCAVGTPVLIGPHTFNFEAVTAGAIEAGAALRVSDAAEMMQRAMQLFAQQEQRESMSRRASGFAAQHRGATMRTIRLIRELLPA